MADASTPTAVSTADADTSAARSTSHAATQTLTHASSPSTSTTLLTAPLGTAAVSTAVPALASLSLGLKGVLADVLHTLSSPVDAVSAMAASAADVDGPPDGYRMPSARESMAAMMSSRRRSSVAVIIPAIPETNEGADAVHESESASSGEGDEERKPASDGEDGATHSDASAAAAGTAVPAMGGESSSSSSSGGGKPGDVDGIAVRHQPVDALVRSPSGGSYTGPSSALEGVAEATPVDAPSPGSPNRHDVTARFTRVSSLGAESSARDNVPPTSAAAMYAAQSAPGTPSASSVLQRSAGRGQGGPGLRAAMHRRRASTGGGPMLRSPMMSPMSMITSAAHAALMGPTAGTPGHADGDGGIATSSWARRHHFFRKSSIGGGAAADATADAAGAGDSPDGTHHAEADTRERSTSQSGVPFSPTGFSMRGLPVVDAQGRLRRTDSAGSQGGMGGAQSPTSVSSANELNAATVPYAVAGLPPMPPTSAAMGRGHHRRRSSVQAYLTSGRRGSEASLTSVPEMNAAAGSPMVLDDSTSGDGGHGDGQAGILETIASIVPPEHVEAALTGLVRVVNRFQALFETEAQPGGLRPSASSMTLSHMDAGDRARDDTPPASITASHAATGSGSGSSGGTAGATPAAVAGATDSPVESSRSVVSDHALIRRDSIESNGSQPVLEDASAHSRRGSMFASSVADGAVLRDTAPSAPTAFQVTITRDDADMLAALVDVLTTAWNAGFYYSYAAAGGATAALASNSNLPSNRDERDPPLTAQRVVDASSDGRARSSSMGGMAPPTLPYSALSSRRSSLATFSSDDAGPMGGLASMSLRRASHAVGQILGVTAEGTTPYSAQTSPSITGVSVTGATGAQATYGASSQAVPSLPPSAIGAVSDAIQSRSTRTGSVSRDSVVAAASGVDEATASEHDAAEGGDVSAPLRSDAISTSARAAPNGEPEPSGSNVNSGERRPRASTGAEKLSLSLAGVSGSGVSAVPAPLVRNMSLRNSLRSNSLVIPSGAPAPSSIMSPTATHRRRSSRVMAREELQRSFMANPAIFDESTREYVAMLVSPQEPRRPGAAKDRLRAAGRKVANIAALSKRAAVAAAAAGVPGAANVAATAPPAVLATPAPVASIVPPLGVLPATDAHSSLPVVAPSAVASRRNTSVLPKQDGLARRLIMAEAFALVGMDAWSFDIFEANTKLLQGHGYLPPGDPAAVAAAIAATGGLITPATAQASAPAAGEPSIVSPRVASGRAPLVSAVSSSVDPVAVVESNMSPHAPRVSLHATDASDLPAAGERRSFTELQPLIHAVPGTSASVRESSGANKFTDVPDTGAGVGTEMLVALTSCALEQSGVMDELGLDRETMGNFLARIARGYHSHPYHNALHGADVCQAMFYVITTGGLAQHLSAEFRLAALLAAAVHDVGHPGVNNVFLTQTSHPLALTYNDRSPLENMHAATTFLTMRRIGCDIFAPLTPEQRSSIRGIVIDMVLATDNAHHFKMIGKIRRRLTRAMRPASTSGGGAAAGADDDDYTSSDDGLDSAATPSSVVTHPLDLRKPSDARLVLMTTLHACDIANPAREWGPCVRWTDRITEEFWIQGDKLKEASLTVPPMHDRVKPIPRPNMQAGFITALVLPLWTLMTEPAFQQIMHIEEILDGLKTNLNTYKDMIEAGKAAAAVAAAQQQPPPAATPALTAPST